LRAVAEPPEAEQDALAVAILADVKGNEAWDVSLKPPPASSSDWPIKP